MLNMTRAGENHSIAFLGKIQFQRPSQLMTWSCSVNRGTICLNQSFF